MEKLLRFFLLIVWVTVIPGTGAAGDDPAEKAPYRGGEILVKFRPEVPDSDRQAIRVLLGVRVEREFKRIGVEHWRLPEGADTEAALRRLGALPEIEYAEPNYVYTPQAMPGDPDFGLLWHLHNTGQWVNGSAGTPGADISAVAAWDTETGDPGMVIAVIDSGVAFEHPDLIQNVWTNGGEIPDNGLDDDGNGYADDVHGWDFVNGDGNPSDYSRDLYGDGHGTHVAGVIAAAGDNGIGTTGVMWRAQIMALQVFDLFQVNAFEGIQNTLILAAVEYAVENGARIINCSFGGYGRSAALFDIFSFADQNGVLVMAAAGNENRSNDLLPVYPAGYDLPNIVSVTAVDEDGGLAAYSNFGPASVDLAAPGGNFFSNIYSTTPPGRDVLFSEDFEAGAAAWETGYAFEGWSIAFRDDFGSSVIQDSVADYHENEASYIQTRVPIDASNYRGLHIQFRTRYLLEADRDFLYVEGATDGENFSVDFPVTRVLTGFSGGIQSLNAWGSEDEIGPEFYLRFRLTSDDAVNFDGAYLDDIRLTGIRWEFTGDEYGFKSGTSMAVPVASGVAGLVWSHRPELTHLEVKQILIASADPHETLTNKVASGGRLNAEKALLADPDSDDADGDAGGTEDGGGGGGCFIDAMTQSFGF
ncbi:S8 family serine peptidase [Desulfococcus sp.]|uniref:S8 family peptidase n=1 Tax=Desulfococcus sp. TaxID=2025834 RepID=UPI0035935D37